MRMRLIDADALIEDAFYLMDRDELLEDVPQIIKDYCDAQPTVNAVPVIRCKDCARNPRNNGGKRILCPCPMDRYMGDEGFCSKAERRGEE